MSLTQEWEATVVRAPSQIRRTEAGRYSMVAARRLMSEHDADTVLALVLTEDLAREMRL